MEKPKMRWIDAVPYEHEGSEMILLRDTEGITDQSLIVSKPAAFLLSLMDGTRSVEELRDEYQRAIGQTVGIEQIRGLVEAMDSNLFLMNDRFVSCFSGLKDEYEKAAIREACLAGKGYPGEMSELLTFLDEMLSTGEVAGPKERSQGYLPPTLITAGAPECTGRCTGTLKAPRSLSLCSSARATRLPKGCGTYRQRTLRLPSALCRIRRNFAT
jgi:hypothetical protein